MPDYRHIKKKAENENQEYQRKLEPSIQISCFQVRNV